MSVEENKKTYTEREILDFAEEEVSEKYIDTAYPIIPTDEWGRPEPYEGGCCNWMICEEFTVISSMIEKRENNEEEDRFDVIIFCNWKWHGEEEEKGIKLYVPIYITEEGLELGEDIERID